MADEHNYDVVVDTEQQCAAWLAGRDLPEGWHHQPGSRMRFLTRAAHIGSGVRPMCLRTRIPDGGLVRRAAT